MGTKCTPYLTLILTQNLEREKYSFIVRHTFMHAIKSPVGIFYDEAQLGFPKHTVRRTLEFFWVGIFHELHRDVRCGGPARYDGSLTLKQDHGGGDRVRVPWEVRHQVTIGVDVIKI